MAQYSISKINIFLMGKQHLSQETKGEDIPKVTKDIWGLHATNAGTPYLSLFNRTNNFSKESLDRGIMEKRLVKIRCVRKTVHIVPKENVSIAFSATKEAIQINSEKYYRYLGVSESEYRNISEAILSLLENKGMNASEIKKELM